MLFSNLLVAIVLTTLWPLGLLGVLAACAWLERRTLVTGEVLPRRIQRMERKPPEAVEAMVLEETAEIVAAYWSSTGRPLPARAGPAENGQRPAATAAQAPASGQGRPVPGRADRAAMRRRPSRGRHERR
ncbi:MAG TPA: hypothetical protein VEP73_01815 [Actinomycetota bacterium]|nr:hypothetical protein [Actinomycetota bacterium]